MASSPNQSSEAVSAHKPLLAVLNGERLGRPPVWMMRQAGRYLPEYRQLRADKGGFLDLVYDSDAAADVTLQPLRRFPELDAAILFSDILIVPFAIGQNLSFVAGEGPRLTPPLVSARARRTEAVPRAAGADLRNGPQGESGARPVEDPDRLRRSALDGRDVHGRRPGQPRPVRDAAARLLGRRSLSGDHRSYRGDHARLSLGPDRGRRGSRAIVR